MLDKLQDTLSTYLSTSPKTARLANPLANSLNWKGFVIFFTKNRFEMLDELG